MKGNQILDNIRYATAKLTFVDKSSEEHIGTGFFFELDLDGKSCILLLVTNKHLTKDWTLLKFKLNKADEEGNPIFGDDVEITVNNDGKQKWIDHPDVDLSVIAIWPAISSMQESGINLCFRVFLDEFIPNSSNMKLISSIEDVLMVGYPDKMADETHNLPIVRKGITATDFKIDFNGRKEFLIDASIFKGSSGSPIVICNIGSYNNAEGKLCLGDRFFFLGVQSHGMFSLFQQNIYIKDSNGKFQNSSDILSVHFNDLGFCVKSECLLYFKEEILRQWREDNINK